MANNYVQPGSVMDYTAPAGGVVSGLTYKIGTMVGVAMVTAAATAKFAMQVDGVHELVKLAGEAWAEGVAVYWDNAASKWTTTVGANSKSGTAGRAQAAGDVLGWVRLNGTGA